MIGPLRFLGRKHGEIATQWIASAGTFGTASTLLICYMTDWKAVLQYLPYYGSKYPKEE